MGKAAAGGAAAATSAASWAAREPGEPGEADEPDAVAESAADPEPSGEHDANSGQDDKDATG